MIEAVFGFVGTLLVIAALLCRKISRSLFLLFLGSITLAVDIALLSGIVSGVIVAGLYAGAMVAMILVWLMLVEEEKTIVDLVYLSSIIGSLATGLIILYGVSSQIGGSIVLLDRPIVVEDIIAVVLALIVSSIGVVYILGGEKTWTR
ncbi:MAG: hypothetical protein DRJ35_06525 [Thermoprotei archaeon]|nr:MAG: hypothetical protein DRJ35_06525 [Thermoprotei archaeon]